ncbi:hypothetical protein GCM10023224_20570 [Streptomonospora halophila]|uniref:Type II toxin-antitoxin system RelE/ParE family toxin n=1 Tax=Streptomonospora halophila TaxID=427369 RepID=A0ABP9GHA4_9ACTN
MSDWTWDFDPSHIGEGLPSAVRAEVEWVAAELVFMGADADNAGRPIDRSGGLREFPLVHGPGFIKYLVAHHRHEIVIVHVTTLG